MEIQEYLNLAFLAIAVIASLVAAFRGGGVVDPLSLALKIVTDAEQMFMPKDGESWDDANTRKLRYALEKMKDHYPGLDPVLMQNLIERAVDVLKQRYAKPAQASRGVAVADSPDKFSQF
jgi:uncharacterized membrane protein